MTWLVACAVVSIELPVYRTDICAVLILLYASTLALFREKSLVILTTFLSQVTRCVTVALIIKFLAGLANEEGLLGRAFALAVAVDLLLVWTDLIC